MYSAQFPSMVISEGPPSVWLHSVQCLYASFSFFHSMLGVFIVSFSHRRLVVTLICGLSVPTRRSHVIMVQTRCQARCLVS